MYLKSIEMLGFKSFPGKTKISFEEGISCIVGPNGAGKSNISDALRWVLGEQSARSLRGGKQEDVIFSGSKKRKALGMAEVTLILDNSDGLLNRPFTEIAVTRRTFRGGGGEFFINNQSCRLKDIHDLFVDTGVGVEGVSLISQGRINELIAAKPEERRAFVEEAAGIVKYRNRKREAMRKLEETERHLERVGDIIGELGGRLQPLRWQAEQAELYLAKREEADKCAVTLAVRLLSEFEDKLAQQTALIGGAGERLLATDTRRLALAAQREQWRSEQARLDEAAGELAQRFYGLQGQAEREKAARAVTEGQIEHARANAARLQAELTELAAAETSRRDEARELTAHVQATGREVEELMELVSKGLGGEEERRAALAYVEQEVAKVREQAFDAANRLAQGRNQLHYQQQLAEKNQVAALRQREQRQELTDNAAQAQARVAEIERLKQALQRQTAEGRAELARRQQDIKKQNDAVGELAAAETELRYRAHALTVRLNMLEEMRKSYEGFYPGVRALLTAKNRGEAGLAGLLDVAANLLTAPPQYQAAVETYLGAALQNIVSVSQQAARQAIAYLKEKDLGRATFLPLDALKVRPPADVRAVSGLKGVHGLASELVSCAEQVRPAADFLLNRLLVVDDIETAVQAARKLDYRLPVVTLEGDMVNPGGSLSGGSRGKKGGELLGKGRELAEAREQQEELKLELVQRERSLQAARDDLAAITAEVEAISARLQDVANQQYALTHEDEGLAKQQAALARQFAALDQELAGLSDEAVLIEEQQRELGGQLTEAEAAEQELSARLNELTEQLSAKSGEWEGEREDVNRRRVELAAREQKLVGQRKSLERIETEIDNIHWDQEAKSADLAQCAQELETAQAALAAAGERLVDLREALMIAGQEMEESRHGLAAEAARIAALEKEEKELAAQCEELRGELHQQELKKARLEADCENERTKLAEQFNMTPEEASACPQLEGSRTALVARLQQLKKDLAALEPVNIAAIEEYREVTERHSFLTAQRADLLQAREQLDTVIAEMDRIMSSRFRQAFQRLSEEFDNSFRRLFGGGQAALTLTDPEDILGTGVDISVDLPGKKIVNYNLLSGGEKVLIGIALMFAVMTVRPSPFILMDEVDAALDEANIDRFTAYLRELAERSQCVMISHRQSTMEAADSLWGVTMEEEGVSKLLSVRLQGQGIA
jgi:chromosome segregation protein